MSKEAVNQRYFRIALASRGLTQNQFAKTLNLDKSTVSLALSGKAASKRVVEAAKKLIEEEFEKMNLRISSEAA